MPVTGVIERTIDINRGVTQEDLHRLFAVADAQAHIFEITITADGSPQSLSGHTVIGYFMRSNNTTVVITGSVSENVATLVLPQACYSIYGGFQLIIRLVNGSTKTAIYWGHGYITRSTTDTVIDPGSVVPNIDDLLARIDQMEQATTAANAAATNANTAAEQAVRFDTVQTKTDAQKLQARNNAGAAGTGSLAPAYAQTTYAVGDMVTQGGKLYKCTTAITTAETWTAGHWEEVTVESEISSLKEDLSDSENRLRAEIAAIEPGLSAKAKAALLACFEHVAWTNTDGKNYYNSLASALESGRTIIGNMLGNYGLWKNAFPYYNTTATNRLTYKDLDVEVTGANIYRLIANTSQQNISMFVNIYNHNVLDKYAIQADITVDDHMDILGGWTDELEQIIVIPKRINNSQAAGIVFGFKYSNDGNISIGAVDSINISEVFVGTLPPDYTAYDYIAVNGSGTTVSTPQDGIIKTLPYDDLTQTDIYMDFMVPSISGSGNLAVLGARSQDWSKAIYIYIIEGTNKFQINSHGSNKISNAFTFGKVTHLDLKQGTSSPTICILNGTKYEFTWQNTVAIKGSFYLFFNGIIDSATYTATLANNIQIGRFTIIDSNGEIDTYIPVVRNEDNVIGIYSLASGQFCTCSNILKATIGNSNCLYKIGNWA